MPEAFLTSDGLKSEHFAFTVLGFGSVKRSVFPHAEGVSWDTTTFWHFVDLLKSGICKHVSYELCSYTAILDEQFVINIGSQYRTQCDINKMMNVWEMSSIIV